MSDDLSLEQLLAAESIDWPLIVKTFVELIGLVDTDVLAAAVAEIFQCKPPMQYLFTLLENYGNYLTLTSEESRLFVAVASIADDHSFEVIMHRTIAVCARGWDAARGFLCVRVFFSHLPLHRTEWLLRDLYVSQGTRRLKAEIQKTYRDKQARWSTIQDCATALTSLNLVEMREDHADLTTAFGTMYLRTVRWVFRGNSALEEETRLKHIEIMRREESQQVCRDVDGGDERLFAYKLVEMYNALMELASDYPMDNFAELIAIVKSNPDVLLHFSNCEENPLNWALLSVLFRLISGDDSYVVGALNLCKSCISLRPELATDMLPWLVTFVAGIGMARETPEASQVLSACHSMLDFSSPHLRLIDIECHQMNSDNGQTPVHFALEKLCNFPRRCWDEPLPDPYLRLLRRVFAPGVVLTPGALLMRNSANLLPIHRAIQIKWHVDAVMAVAEAAPAALSMRFPDTRLLPFQESAVPCYGEDDGEEDMLHLDRIYRLLRMAPAESLQQNCPSFVSSPVCIAAARAQMESQRTLLAAQRQALSAGRELDMTFATWREERVDLSH